MANSSQTILITGATGSNGIEILKLLAAVESAIRQSRRFAIAMLI
jgi:FlaA1/EpsC-like NDP-sugar epimerase